jgi:hypothetical protein
MGFLVLDTRILLRKQNKSAISLSCRKQQLLKHAVGPPDTGQNQVSFGPSKQRTAMGAKNDVPLTGKFTNNS